MDGLELKRLQEIEKIRGRAQLTTEELAILDSNQTTSKPEEVFDQKKTAKFYVWFFAICAVGAAISDITSKTSSATVDSKISPAEFVPACIAAHEAIKGKLISPATANFPNCVYATEGEHDIISDGDKKFTMYGYVDSQNVYGAQIRQKWVVSLLQTDDFKFTVIASGFN